MLQKIKKIKSAGIYKNFVWKDAETPAFKKFNLIYGWNRSGKTTLSRIFDSCEAKTFNSNLPPEAEFSIQSETSEIKSDQLVSSTLKIRVFSEDFVKRNVHYENDSKTCEAIIIVGEEDAKKVSELRKLKVHLSMLEETTITKQEECERRKARLNEIFQDAGKDVKTQLATGAGITECQAYDKRKAEEFVTRIGIDKLKTLDEKSFKQNKSDISEIGQKSKVGKLGVYEPSFKVGAKEFKSFVDLCSVVNELLQRVVTVDAIERLKNNPEIDKWVREGMALTQKTSSKKCLYCDKKLEPELIEQLEKHFGDAYLSFKTEVQNFKIVLAGGLIKPAEIDKDQLFDGEKDEYEKLLQNYVLRVTEINDWITTACQAMESKNESPFQKFELAEPKVDLKEQINGSISGLNEFIQRHNDQIDGQDKKRSELLERLIAHVIVTKLEDKKYREELSAFETAKAALPVLSSEKGTLTASIQTLESEVSNAARGVAILNKHLEEFFGIDELKLEMSEDGKGYVLKRGEKVAKNLSQGEKTALAFSHFITSLAQSDGKIEEIIVVVDDPISSFDSGNIHHCFGMVRAYFLKAKQVFILTHNFEFFGLVRDWFEKMGHSADKCEFYQLRVNGKGNDKESEIVRLDETLKRHRSEYQYLFSLLKDFVDGTPKDYSEYYTIGNIARRFMEIYSGFKLPKKVNLYENLGTLCAQAGISNPVKEKIYKLVQEYSHGDFGASLQHYDRTEAKSAVTAILEIVEKTDPKHYEILKSEYSARN